MLYLSFFDIIPAAHASLGLVRPLLYYVVVCCVCVLCCVLCAVCCVLRSACRALSLGVQGVTSLAFFGGAIFLCAVSALVHHERFKSRLLEMCVCVCVLFCAVSFCLFFCVLLVERAMAEVVFSHFFCVTFSFEALSTSLPDLIPLASTHTSRLVCVVCEWRVRCVCMCVCVCVFM